MKPPAIHLRNLAVQRALAFRDDWEDCREDRALAPRKAHALLAAWGELCRFFEPPRLPDDAVLLPGFIHDASHDLLDALRHLPEPIEWHERAQELDQGWDHTAQSHALQELELASLDLFSQLDADAMAVCMARRLARNSGIGADWLESWSQQVRENESFFIAHRDAFLPAATRAIAILNDCRPDLDEADPDLWATTLKCRYLEELAEELEMTALPHLNERDRQAMQDQAHATRQPLRQSSLVTMVRDRLAYAYDVLPSALLAAAGTPMDELPGNRAALVWKKPDGTIEARLLLPAADRPVLGEERVRLNLYRTNTGEPALELADHRIRLAGIARVLDERAQADFTLRELHDARQDLVLEVDGEPWPAMSET